MSKRLPIFLLGFLLSLPAFGEEKPKNTLPQDKLTLEKARASLAATENGKGLFFKPLFDLPKNSKSEIVDTKLTYRKALASLEAFQKRHSPKKKDKRILYEKPSKK